MVVLPLFEIVNFKREGFHSIQFLRRQKEHSSISRDLNPFEIFNEYNRIPFAKYEGIRETML